MTTNDCRSVCSECSVWIEQISCFAVYAKRLGNGLDEQLERFVREHPDTRLIIIDTLQKIRELGGEAYSYADDYQIVGRLKQFADKNGICMLVVHHTRKTPAGDKFERISGTTGLLGCAAGTMISIDTIAVENEVADNMYERSELDYLVYDAPLEYADLILNGDPVKYMKTVTIYKLFES